MAGRVRVERPDRRRGKTPLGPGLEPWPLRHSLVVFLVGAGAALGVFALVYRATDGDPTRDRVDVAIKAAAAVAAVAAGLLTWARLELSRHEHRLGVDRDLTERYGRAVDQLGSDDELVRVGGVFAMERFALDAVRADPANDVDWRMALGVLAALARHDSAGAADSVVPEQSGDDPREPEPARPPSVREAVQALGRFAERSGRRLPADRHDLRGVMAPGAYLAQANLRGANFAGANLAYADLRGADLGTSMSGGADPSGASVIVAALGGALGATIFAGADLAYTDFRGANLAGAILGTANLRRANLAGADLRAANLIDADLRAGDLSGASLVGADLTLANLGDATLTEADFMGANFSQANLAGADLSRASLLGADLTLANLAGANLAGADLSGANVHEAELTEIRHSDVTVWPEGFDPPPSA